MPFPIYEISEDDRKQMDEKRKMKDEQRMMDDVRYFEGMKEKGGSWIMDEVSFIRHDIDEMNGALHNLQSVVAGTDIGGDVEEVLSVMNKAYTLLDKIEAKASTVTDNKDLDKLFKDLEGLERFIGSPMGRVNAFFASNKHTLGLSAEQMGDVEKLAGFDKKQGPAGPKPYNQECRKCGYMDDVYSGDTVTRLQTMAYDSNFDLDSLVTSLISQISDSILEQVMQYVENEVAAQITAAVIRQVDTLKKDIYADLGINANVLLANTTTVAESIAEIDYPNAGNYTALQNIAAEIADTAVLDADPVEEFLQTVEGTVEAATPPSPLAISALVAQGEELLDALEKDLVENKMDFYDMPGLLEEETSDLWYGETVYEGLAEGYWNGYDNGNFGAADPVLGTEFTKMAVNVFDFGTAPNAGEHWYDGYVASAEQEGVSVDIENAPINRGEVAQVLYELGDYPEPPTCDGYFTDLDSSNPNCKAIVALYNEGIVTGNPDGSYNPEGTLNRAEASAFIIRTGDVVETEEFGATLDTEVEAYYQDYYLASHSSVRQGFFARIVQGIMSLFK